MNMPSFREFQEEMENQRRMLMDNMRYVSPNINHEEKPKPKKQPSVTWDDVVGLEEAKKQLQEAIEARFTHKEIYEAFNISPSKGVLLYGPPGCGKTMIGKAAASAMAKVHNKDVFDGFFYYNGAEMFGPHVGHEERWMRDAFEKAEDFNKQNGFPAILFFDEADSMLPRREISPPWTRNAVNQFLSLMDGMKECTAFVILATNNHLILDEAAIRSGRIDRKIYIGPPTKEAIGKILEKCFMKKPKKGPLHEDVLNAIFDETQYVGKKLFSEYINGANAAAIADRAASIAFNRCMETCEKKRLYVTKADAMKAVEILFSEVVEFSKIIENIKPPKLQVDINHKIQDDGTSQDIY